VSEEQDFEQAGSHSLKRYLEIPRRRPWHIVVPCISLAIVAFGVSFLIPRLYKTQTMILVESQKVPESIVRRSSEDEQAKPRLATIRQEIMSRTRIETVLKELNPYPDLMGRTPLTSIVEKMRSATEIVVKGNEAFSIEYVHEDPKKAMEVTNRLATLFIDETSRSREDSVKGANSFLEGVLAAAKKELDEKDREVRRYKELHTGRLPEQTPSNLAALERFQMERQNIETQLSSARQRELMLERGVGDTITTPSGQVVAAVDPNRDLNKAREELAVMRTRYTDEHPDVRAQLARIARLEREAGDAERRAAATTTPAAPPAGNRMQLEQVRSDIRALEMRKSQTEAQMGAYQGRVEDSPRTEQELKTLTRDFDQLNENYKSLLAKKINAQMAEKMEERWKGERFSVLDPAYVPEEPYFPNRTLFALVGAVVGLIIGLSLAFGAELFDQSVKDEADLAELIPQPVLVTFPSIPATIGPSRGGHSGGGGYTARGSADVLELDEWRSRGRASRG
jgi:polysaccharide chain length determinant protein (PEP-CTERM system associated)